MCGRYSAWFDDRDLAEIARALGAELAFVGPPPDPSANLAPTSRAPIVVGRPTRRIGLARFGWEPSSTGVAGEAPRTGTAPAPAPASTPTRLVNARSETAARSPTFGESLARRRCAVLADGYYEWKGTPGNKTPFFTRTAAGDPLFLAGMYRLAASGPRDPSFVVLTRPATGVAATIHDRMPVLLQGEALARFLDPDEPDPERLLRDVLASTPPATRTHEVSRQVSSPRHRGAELREPVGPDLGS